MCVSCDCGKPNERHKDGDITMDDLKKAATNSSIDVAQVAKNIQKAAQQGGTSA